jgi:hypothetical protein
LTTQFADTLEELQLFPFVVGHEAILLDNTHPGYGTKRSRTFGHTPILSSAA